MGLSIYELNTSAENLWLDNNAALAKNIFLNQANQAVGLNKLNNLAIDVLNDNSGINASSANYSYDSVNKLVQPIAAAGKMITAYGDAKIIGSMTSSIGIGYFNGSSRVTYADSNDFAFGSGDFTIEGWFNFPTITNCYLFGQFNTAGYAPVDIQLWNNKIGIDASTNGSTFISGFNNAYGTTTIQAKTWYHIAVVRNGTTMTVYLNGNVEYSSSISTTALWDATENFVIGGRKADYPMTAYCDEFRITKGTARYTSTFIPSITPFTADTNTILLVHMDTDFTDDVGSTGHTAKVPTVTSAVITTIIKKIGNGSIYLDGTGDALYAADSADWAFGTGDFCVEGYFYFVSGTIGGNTFFGQRVDGNNGWRFTILADNTIRFYNQTNGTITIDMISAVQTWSTGTWYHIAVNRIGNVFTVFRNGVVIMTTTDTDPMSDFGANLDAAGFNVAGGGTNSLPIYLDEIRISKGIARYPTSTVGSTAFTPPTTQFEYDTYTKLLIHGDSLTGASGITDISNGYLNMTFISNTITTSSVPSKAFVIKDETLNGGTITYYISRDNGTTWTACSPEVVTDISAQPSGTNMKVKAVTSGSLNSKINAIAFGWK